MYGAAKLSALYREALEAKGLTAAEIGEASIRGLTKIAGRTGILDRTCARRNQPT